MQRILVIDFPAKIRIAKGIAGAFLPHAETLLETCLHGSQRCLTRSIVEFHWIGFQIIEFPLGRIGKTLHHQARRVIVDQFLRLGVGGVATDAFARRQFAGAQVVNQFVTFRR